MLVVLVVPWVAAVVVVRVGVVEEHIGGLPVQFPVAPSQMRKGLPFIE